ncbi:hypothetical protein Bbelb_141400 [Branchiostoma belcheri]|nr:hypothetical protein Bbelb_141400 [Branchiostoma belcheri]
MSDETARSNRYGPETKAGRREAATRAKSHLFTSVLDPDPSSVVNWRRVVHTFTWRSQGGRLERSPQAARSELRRVLTQVRRTSSLVNRPPWLTAISTALGVCPVRLASLQAHVRQTSSLVNRPSWPTDKLTDLYGARSVPVRLASLQAHSRVFNKTAIIRNVGNIDCQRKGQQTAAETLQSGHGRDWSHQTSDCPIRGFSEQTTARGRAGVRRDTAWEGAAKPSTSTTNRSQVTTAFPPGHFRFISTNRHSDKLTEVRQTHVMFAHAFGTWKLYKYATKYAEVDNTSETDRGEEKAHLSSAPSDKYFPPDGCVLVTRCRVWKAGPCLPADSFHRSSHAMYSKGTRPRS